MKYDIIIAGAGAAGLFAAANIKLRPGQHGLILNRVSRPGIKLLMSGAGQCNLTHSGDIKEFTEHYGPSGKRIRPLLYSFSNKDTIEWFTSQGLPLFTRGDGKIFPKSLSAGDVLDLLKKKAEKNGFHIVNDSGISEISPDLVIRTESRDPAYKSLETHILLLAGGGSSYPSSGSDGSLLKALSPLALSIVPARPSLVPINVESYPYTSLSGYAVKGARVYIYAGKDRTKKAASIKDDVLFTHKNFSGPGILNMSRYAENGYTLEISWLPDTNREVLLSELNALRKGNRKTAFNVLREYFSLHGLSDAFIDISCRRVFSDPDQKFADLPGKQLSALIDHLLSDRFVISGTSGWNNAMATKGGIDLKDIDLKEMRLKAFDNIYAAGEILDVDGDTGGYNLQFAFSSAYAAAVSIQNKLKPL